MWRFDDRFINFGDDKVAQFQPVAKRLFTKNRTFCVHTKHRESRHKPSSLMELSNRDNHSFYIAIMNKPIKEIAT
jgi:hypothetical protein